MDVSKIFWLILDFANDFITALFDSAPQFISTFKAISSIKPLNLLCNVLEISPIIISVLLFTIKTLIYSKK